VNHIRNKIHREVQTSTIYLMLGWSWMRVRFNVPPNT